MNQHEDCESCDILIGDYGLENLEVCEFCGHYYVQNKHNTGFCTCTKGEQKVSNYFVLCMKCQTSLHISKSKLHHEWRYCTTCFDIITKYTIYSSGQCPYCKSENIHHGELVFGTDATHAYYPISCLECCKESKEWYEFVYSRTEGNS